MAPRVRNGVVTANVAKAKIDGKTIGVMQQVSGQINTGMMPVTGIGRNNPYEHEAGAAQYSVSCETLRLRKSYQNADLTTLAAQNPETAGIMPKNAKEILNGWVFDVVIEDENGAAIYTWQDCSFASGSISMSKHQIVGQGLQFMAIDCLIAA